MSERKTVFFTTENWAWLCPLTQPLSQIVNAALDSARSGKIYVPPSPGVSGEMRDAAAQSGNEGADPSTR